MTSCQCVAGRFCLVNNGMDSFHCVSAPDLLPSFTPRFKARQRHRGLRREILHLCKLEYASIWREGLTDLLLFLFQGLH